MNLIKCKQGAIAMARIPANPEEASRNVLARSFQHLDEMPMMKQERARDLVTPIVLRRRLDKALEIRSADSVNGAACVDQSNQLRMPHVAWSRRKGIP
ncbi:MAG: hypothetical protein MUC68_02580, partial [Burkholderiaceae bacterium]|jgi:hypothetical protein|nr:hypothetical protein [Burkholderiaceae bacterium]